MLGGTRPSFEVSSHESAEAILCAVQRRLRTEASLMSGLVAKGRIELQVPRADEHLWSPQLIVDLEEGSEGTRLRGRFGPHPSVWTMFVAGYAISAAGTFMALMFAVAQWTMGDNPWALVVALGALAMGVGVYGLALVGRGLGDHQMTTLRVFLEETLESARHGH